MGDQLIQLLVRHEGLRLKPYVDTVGKLTIGVGHNCTDKGITRAQALAILDDDVIDATVDANRLCSVFDELGPVRQAVLVNMAFNLGYERLSKFVRVLGAVHMSHWDEAADFMLQSKWAIQVGQRAIELADMMRTNHFPEWVASDAVN